MMVFIIGGNERRKPQEQGSLVRFLYIYLQCRNYAHDKNTVFLQKQERKQKHRMYLIFIIDCLYFKLAIARSSIRAYVGFNYKKQPMSISKIQYVCNAQQRRQSTDFRIYNIIRDGLKKEKQYGNRFEIVTISSS